jgi:uncharacterized membrane protein
MPLETPLDQNTAGQSFVPPVQMSLPGMLMGHFQHTQLWQSPFPPPDAIERYVGVQPDAFDRILKLTETGQQANIEANMKAIALQAKDTRRGHYLGFAVTFGAIVGAVALAYFKQPVVAGLLVSVPVMGVAQQFIRGKSGSDQAAGAKDATTAKNSQP